MLDPLYGDAHTMSGSRAHRRWGRRPSTGGGVDRLKMSARQAAMLGSNIFSNKLLGTSRTEDDCERVQIEKVPNTWPRFYSVEFDNSTV